MFASGGFMNQTATQGFSMGLGERSQVGSGGEAPRKKKEEAPATVLPVTICAIEAALAKRADDGGSGELQFYGLEHGMIILVAAVEVVSKKETSMELVLNDSTGRIKARFYTHGEQSDEYNDVVPGRYVYVFGNVRTSPMVHFAVTGLRLVSSANEVSYHMIECAYAALKLRRGVVEPTTPMVKKDAHAGKDELRGPNAMELSPPPVAAPPEPAPTMSVLDAATPMTAPRARLEGAALRGAVLDFIRSKGTERPEGVEFSAVAAHAQPTPAAEVRSTVEELVASGDIFTTLDDEHFQIL